MTEQLVSIAAAAIVFVIAFVRLNEIRLERPTVTPWHVLEGSGLITVAGGCVGVIGEWFIPGADFASATIVMVGAAIFGVGVSHTLQHLAQGTSVKHPAPIRALAEDELEHAEGQR